ncbi:MAG: hypothetical protein M3O15_09440, partial [Acidobacteriota bacterium]|nr:hypothetical protein [Acidobacteriota bacterium]
MLETFWQLPAWILVLKLGLVLAVLQGGCHLLARGLRMRLGRTAAVLGCVLPPLVVLPWLARGDLLIPTGILSGILPGLPVLPARDPHFLLSDTVYQLLPWEFEVRRALLGLHLPLWSDRLEGGSSPWMNPQAAVLSPVAMLARALPIQQLFLA